MKEKEHIPESILKAGKEPPFQLPDSYFDELPGRILDRIPGSEHVNRGPRIARTWMARAAIFIGLIAIGITGMRILGDRSGTIRLSETEITEAIEHFAWDVDDDLLASMVIDSEISLLEETDEGTVEIIQYLSEDEIDLSTLINDF